MRGKAAGEAPKYGKRKFTDATVKALPLPEVGQYEVHDTQTRGLSIRVSFKGTKSFYLHFSLGGKRRRYYIGTFEESRAADASGKSGTCKVEDARRIARHKWQLIQDGID